MESDVERQIRLIKERAQARTKNLKRKRSKTRINQVEEDAKFFYRFYLQFIAAAFWIWQKIIQPVTSLIWRVVSWLFGIYRKVWSFFVYRRNEFGDLKFSKIRAAVFLMVSIPMLMVSGNVIVDSSIFSLTYRANETIYLFNSSDNSFREDDEFSVTGCEITEINPDVGFECKSEDTLYFRVSPGVVEHIYSITNNGRLFYSDTIASVIAPGWNICETDSWYFRLKTLIRNTNIYPKLLDASCRPLPRN